MAGLALQELSKSYGPVAALCEVSLAVPHGQFVCLLGPSGCGKTTLLRLIAGLEEPTRGRVLLDGRDITSVPAHRRDLGMVFQSLALFPHLTAGENIAYPLRIRGVDREAQRRRVGELLELVRLPGLAGRPVNRLSGGQRQRIAIARALALSPKLFLLDEPLSALDAKLREAMQIELKQLQRQLGITTILVTHDQREAMTMADLVVVMHDGRVRQSDPPAEVYRRPIDAFVADFIGTTNILRGQTEGGRLRLAAGELDLPQLEGREGDTVVSVRPEDIHLHPNATPGPNRLVGRVAFMRDLGANLELRIDCAGTELVVWTLPKQAMGLATGAAVTLEVPAESCVVLAA